MALPDGDVLENLYYFDVDWGVGTTFAPNITATGNLNFFDVEYGVAFPQGVDAVSARRPVTLFIT